jgi:hypothetical protein
MWRKKKAEIPRRRQADAARIGAQREAEQSGQKLFKRNRTLVGSSSSTVSSVNEMGGDLRSPRAHHHHLAAHRRKLSSMLLVVLVGIASLTWLLYEFTGFVQVSASDSSLAIDQSKYQRLIGDYLGSRPGERIRFFMNEQELTRYMALVAPEVSSVHVRGAAGVATSQIDIVFRRPVAGWLINSKQYYVDKDGVSFQANYFERPTVRIVDQSGVPQTTGSTVASSRFLRFVGRTVELAQTNGLTVEQALIPSGTTRQIEVRLAKHAYPIKLSLDRPVGEQVEDMQRAVAYFDARGAKPQYVDVRVSGKAYYR